MAIAVATPAIFPVPTVAERAVIKALLGAIVPFSCESLFDFTSLNP